MPDPDIVTRADHDPSWIRRARERGEVVAVLPGVHLRAELAGDAVWLARAVMAWRPDAVICGALAARLTFWREIEVDVIDVAARTTVRRDGFRFSDRVIPTALHTRYGHVEITVPALTALDLCLTHGSEAIDRALRSRLVTAEHLERVLAATAHRSGNGDRRREVVAARTRPWSAAERLAHRVLREAGIGGWVANAAVPIDLWTYYLDLAFTEVMLAVEIDGFEVHTRRDVFEDDRERQNELVLAGWTVLRFTYRQLTERPDRVVETVRRGIRIAGSRRGRRPQAARARLQSAT